MENVNADGTFLCEHEACECRVADDENHYKTATGIYCCWECSQGKGCEHAPCNCAVAGRG